MPILMIYADTAQGGRCKSDGCRKPIVWVEQTNGKRHPLDGALKDLTPVKTETINGRQVQHIDTSVNTSHFATCPDADKFRRKK